MMLITVGTLQLPFQRMVNVVSRIVSLYPTINLIIQSGHTTGFNQFKNRAQVKPFIPQHNLWEIMTNSEVLLTHGGEGSLLDAIEWSPHLPIVFPRDKKFGEHVDNYQQEIAQAADAKGLCIAAKTEDEIIQIIKNCHESHRHIKNNKQGKSVQNDKLITYLSQVSRRWSDDK